MSDISISNFFQAARQVIQNQGTLHIDSKKNKILVRGHHVSHLHDKMQGNNLEEGRTANLSLLNNLQKSAANAGHGVWFNQASGRLSQSIDQPRARFSHLCASVSCGLGMVYEQQQQANVTSEIAIVFRPVKISVGDDDVAEKDSQVLTALSQQSGVSTKELHLNRANIEQKTQDFISSLLRGDVGLKTESTYVERQVDKHQQIKPEFVHAVALKIVQDMGKSGEFREVGPRTHQRGSHVIELPHSGDQKRLDGLFQQHGRSKILQAQAVESERVEEGPLVMQTPPLSRRL